MNQLDEIPVTADDLIIALRDAKKENKYTEINLGNGFFILVFQSGNFTLTRR